MFIFDVIFLFVVNNACSKVLSSTVLQTAVNYCTRDDCIVTLGYNLLNLINVFIMYLAGEDVNKTTTT